jgi:hypothetical protein
VDSGNINSCVLHRTRPPDGRRDMKDEGKSIDRMMVYKNFRRVSRMIWIIRTAKDKYGRAMTYNSTRAGTRRG